MSIYTVEFVYLDEATPRDLHTRSVKAIDAAAAEEDVLVRSIVAGDRIAITGTMTRA